MKYVFGVLLALLVIVFGALFIFGGDDKSTTEQVTVPVLSDYAKGNSKIVFTTYGRLVGDDERRTIRITVTPAERRLEVLGGYTENVISTKSYQNNTAAYENLLSSLQRSGFMSSRKSTIDDPRGICPTGNRFEYKLVDNGRDVSNLWSNTCDKTGTFAGAARQVRTVIQSQIPDYKKQVSGVKL